MIDGYTVYPYPQLFPGRDATFADGHAWVMPTKERTPQQREAAYRLMKFLADNDFEWSRTGHLPAFTAIIDSERFKSLPHRDNIAKLSITGTPLPAEVQRQFAIEDIIGEELAPAIAGQKSDRRRARRRRASRERTAVPSPEHRGATERTVHHV